MRAPPLFWALDFNVDPMSSIVAQKRGEEIRVLDEVVLSRASTLQACEEFHARYPNHQAGIVIYGDASGQRLQTAGTTDYQIIKEYFRRTAYRNLKFRVPPSNPSVRERVALVNAKLFSAERRGTVDDSSTVHGTGRGLRRGDVQAGDERDRQRAGFQEDALIGRAGLLDLAGVPAAGDLRRAGPKADLMAKEYLMNIGNVGPDITHEHPEYAAKRAMWRQYRDLYAGGEQFIASADQYLVRRQKEPGDVYLERLSRSFYENYVGSIVDWYTATLFRREPV